MRDGEWLPERRSASSLRARNRAWLGFAPLPALSLLLLALSFEASSEGGFGSLFFSFASVAVLALTVRLIRRERRFRSRAIVPEESAMLYEIDVPDAVLVSIWIVQGSAVTGHDRGAMWIEDGRLVFSRRRTSFALPRTEILLLSSPRRGPGEFEIELNRSTAVGPLRLSVATLIGDRPFATPIERTVANWMEVKAASSGEGQWPPLALGPNALSADRLRGRWVAKRCALALGACFFGLPIALTLGIWPFFVTSLTLVFLASFALPSLAGPRAIRDRKALEEG